MIMPVYSSPGEDDGARKRRRNGKQRSRECRGAV